MAYLPTGPLIERLRLSDDPRPLRGGPHLGRCGLDGTARELSRISGCSVESAHRQLRRIMNGRIRFVLDSTADNIACALKMHPSMIWAEWYEATDGGVREARMLRSVR